VDAYVAAREGAGVFALPDRALIAVTGPLRQKFLHNILSNDVQSLAAGQGSRAAVMDVKGHLVAFLRALVDREEILLEVAGGRASAVEELLVHYRVAAPVRFRRPDTGVIALVGPRAAPVLRGAGAELPELAAEAHAVVEVGAAQVRVARAGDLPAGGFVLHVPPEVRDAVVASLTSAGAVALPPAVVDVLRIEDGRPWFGPDVSDENLLHETTLIGEYHSPTKGCYVGQEVIARLSARGGHVNKLLRGLRLAAPGAAGERIHAGGKEVGRITTAGVSPALGPIAMGYVHRSAAEPGTVVEVASKPATVARLPLRPWDVSMAQDKES
jgi:folate-binding protein YgfZ